MASTYSNILGGLDPCQFSSSVQGSDASLVRSSGWQTGYRSHQWMLSGSTYMQISFGNLTLVSSIQLTVPAAFAPILSIQVGYSWDGVSFAVDSMVYPVNGSSSYIVPLASSLLIRYLRIYIIDVVQPSDLLTKTTGFILNVTGLVNTSDTTVASKINFDRSNRKTVFYSGVCPSTSSALNVRSVLVTPPTQTGLTYGDDVYVCDESITR